MAPGGELAVVVSYCSNERMFARALFRNALEAAPGRVFVAVGCRLYTGEAEDLAHLAEVRAEFPALKFAVYDVTDEQLADPIALHNEARRAGVAAARAACGPDAWVLLLDGDEVPEGAALRAWWAVVAPGLRPVLALKMANWWYFLSPRLVADVHEDSVVLVHASRLTDAALAHPRERDGVLMCHEAVGGSVVRMVYGLEPDRPLFHHFSWVRSGRAGLLAKVANWGHRRDAPWAELVNRAVDAAEGAERTGAGWPARDFVHGHALRALDRAPFPELAAAGPA